ncbi:hypothetical protein ACU70A_08700 [Syntrophomonas erecta subsp. sporosyntropha]
MQVRFRFNPTMNKKIEVENPLMFKPIQLEDAEIVWDIDINKKIKDITIVFKGVDIIKDSSGAILTTNRELDEKAFKIAAYISNKIFLGTGIDGFNPENILYNSPSIFPENEKEKEIIEKGRKQGFNIVKGTVTIVKPFELEGLEEDIKHSKAIAFYAEARRTEGSIQKYELLYKVIEYFFPNKTGEALDKAVSDYCKQYDPTYGDKKFMESFRKLRNRCIHPDNKHHVNLEDLASIREVIDMVPKIENLVELLLKNHL